MCICCAKRHRKRMRKFGRRQKGGEKKLTQNKSTKPPNQKTPVHINKEGKSKQFFVGKTRKKEGDDLKRKQSETPEKRIL